MWWMLVVLFLRRGGAGGRRVRRRPRRAARQILWGFIGSLCGWFARKKAVGKITLPELSLIQLEVALSEGFSLSSNSGVDHELNGAP